MRRRVIPKYRLPRRHFTAAPLTNSSSSPAKKPNAFGKRPRKTGKTGKDRPRPRFSPMRSAMNPLQPLRTRIFDVRPRALRRAASRGPQGLRFLASPAVIALGICLAAGPASAQEKPSLRIGFSPDATKAKELPNPLVLRPNIEQDL